MRLNALRDGQQIIEYLLILMERYRVQREQVEALLDKALSLSAGRASEASLDDAQAARFSNSLISTEHHPRSSKTPASAHGTRPRSSARRSISRSRGRRTP
jgi:hypothetical protein